MAASPPHSPSNRKWGAAKLGKLIYDAMGEVDEFLGDKFTEEQKDWAKDFVRDLYFGELRTTSLMWSLLFKESDTEY